MKDVNEHDDARGEQGAALSTPLLLAVALAFLLGAVLTGYLGWTLLPE